MTASPLLLLAAAILLGGPISYAFARIFTKRARGWAEGYAFNDLFIGFKENYAGVIGTEALVVLYTLLWSLIPIAGVVLGNRVNEVATQLEEHAYAPSDIDTATEATIEALLESTGDRHAAYYTDYE